MHKSRKVQRLTCMIKKSALSLQSSGMGFVTFLQISETTSHQTFVQFFTKVVTQLVITEYLAFTLSEDKLLKSKYTP